jgi:excinuclease ABC subunit A
MGERNRTDNYEDIVIKGEREHNLKNIDLVVPGTSWVVYRLSGSAVELAFDTIYAEGSGGLGEPLFLRAAVFSARWKSRIRSIDGLSPAISIDQKSTSHNPRTRSAP